MEFTFDHYQESAQAIRARIGDFTPRVAMILGSGGRLVFGQLEGKPVAVMQGRVHYYEGCSLQEVAYAVRVLRLLG